MDNKLLILAGGASSRMKKSLKKIDLPRSVAQVAAQQHKSLIPLGAEKKPLLIRLLENAIAAGYHKIYIVTAPNQTAFQQALDRHAESCKNVTIYFAVQHTPKGRDKPLGTADAVAQTLHQYPDLISGEFSLCNGDNLYSIASMQQLLKHRKAPHAMIAYAQSTLNFPASRIARFALLKMDSNNNLIQIIEKPQMEELSTIQKTGKESFVSMNLFRFSGRLLLPYLENCPLHPERDEKELPIAVEQMINDHPKSLLCYPWHENVADLTSAKDIGLF